MKQETNFKQTEVGIFPTEWEIKEIGNICDIKSGKRLPKGHNLQEEITKHPYIRVKDLSNSTVNVDELLFLKEETYEKISKYIIEKDDVYISIVGTIGIVGTVPQSLDGANLTENCARLTNINGALKEWVSYYLNSNKGQSQIKAYTVGTTQPKLALYRIEKIKIPLPPLAEQKAIAKILSDLDAKIELNKKMNKTLEEIGQAIFKRWFIDFEFPDDEGKPYKSSGGEMVYNEELEKEIPKYWEVKPIDKIANFLNGLVLKKYPPGKENEYLPVIKIKELRQGITNSSDVTSTNIPKEFIINDGDILFSWSGSLEVVIWADGKGALNQHLFKVTSENYPKWFCYYWIMQYLPEFRNIAKGKATTMGHIQRRHLKDTLVLVPPEDTLLKMDKVMGPLIEKIVKVKLESRKLSMIRDSLLPKLISGKIRVPVENEEINY